MPYTAALSSRRAAVLLRREIAGGTLAGRSDRGLCDEAGPGGDLLLALYVLLFTVCGFAPFDDEACYRIENWALRFSLSYSGSQVCGFERGPTFMRPFSRGSALLPGILSAPPRYCVLHRASYKPGLSSPDVPHPREAAISVL